MCKSRIEKAALSVSGVSYANCDAETKMVSVHFDDKNTDKEVIAKSIADAGHDTEFDKASREIYNELPVCCKYTRDEHEH